MCARTIKVECVRAQFLEKKTMHSSSGPAFDSSNFKQANKKDAKFAPTNSTTRAGKSLALAPKNTGYGTYDIYSQGSEQVASAQIKYRMRHVLQEWWAQQLSPRSVTMHPLSHTFCRANRGFLQDTSMGAGGGAVAARRSLPVEPPTLANAHAGGVTPPAKRAKKSKND